ncbi:12069_t:CDS:2 [Acaulospora colombiana]|uniref:12069_t:CDS:1 n=1 Tax=Acaulospora colombiana TaxID=27376 RepID=A0ACA9LBE0_9GLOM|nr:12069_t:CDS:2 [Acaulospora colombiana]
MLVKVAEKSVVSVLQYVITVFQRDVQKNANVQKKQIFAITAKTINWTVSDNNLDVSNNLTNDDGKSNIISENVERTSDKNPNEENSEYNIFEGTRDKDPNGENSEDDIFEGTDDNPDDENSEDDIFEDGIFEGTSDNPNDENSEYHNPEYSNAGNDPENGNFSVNFESENLENNIIEDINLESNDLGDGNFENIDNNFENDYMQHQFPCYNPEDSDFVEIDDLGDGDYMKYMLLGDRDFAGDMLKKDFF